MDDNLREYAEHISRQLFPIKVGILATERLVQAALQAMREACAEELYSAGFQVDDMGNIHGYDEAEAAILSAVPEIPVEEENTE